jgi:hypothetical protein
MGVNNIFVKQFFQKKWSKNKHPGAFIRKNTVFWASMLILLIMCLFWDFWQKYSQNDEISQNFWEKCSFLEKWGKKFEKNISELYYIYIRIVYQNCIIYISELYIRIVLYMYTELLYMYIRKIYQNCII